MTRAGWSHNPMKLLSLGFLLAIVFVSTTNTFAAGGSTVSLSKDEETKIRKTIEAMEEEQRRFVLDGDVAGVTRDWADDLAVNPPNNQVLRKPEILERMKQHTGLQYSSYELHREAMVIRRDCVVTMGYEIVVPKGNVPNSGKTINRRYTDVFYLDDGRWRMIGRQATNISVQ